MKLGLLKLQAWTVLIATLAAASGATYAGQPLMTTQLVSPATTPGSAVELHVFVQDVTNVRGYQTRISIQLTSGSGTVSVECPLGASDPNVRVDTDRSDFIFDNVPNVFSSTNCVTRSVTAARLSGGSDVGVTPAYLATYTLTVSEDAAPGSTFEIRVDPPPDSELADPLSQPIPFDVGAPSILEIVPHENLIFDTSFCSNCLRIGDTATVQLRVFGLQEPINGVQAVFSFDSAVLELSSTIMGDGEGSPWDSAALIYLEEVEGDAMIAVVLVGESTQAESVVATLIFDTVGSGTSSIDFREADPPLATKLTSAATSATILPNTSGSSEMIVGQRSKGDLNGDGARDGLDIQRFVEILLDPQSATAEEFCAAELSGDSQVTRDVDAEMFVNCLVNEICICP